jgi:tetratricopeptide (TPR) repeat protein
MRAVTVAAVFACAAARLAAQDVAGHIAAGDAARCRHNAAEELAHFRAALALDSMHYETLWKASQALMDVAREQPPAQHPRRDSLYAEALVLAQRAVAVNSGGADGHFMVAVASGRTALTKGPRDRVRYAGVVRESALRAVELNPRHDGALHVLGSWNAEIRRLPGMTRFFAKTFLGASVFNQASWANAVNYFNQAIEIAPQHILHRLDLAEALVDDDREPDAMAQLQYIATLPLGCDPRDAAHKQQAAALLQRISR